jgi:hypothetical protein
MMFVILTSREGRFRAEAPAAMRLVEAYRYCHGARALATFAIAEAVPEARIRIVDQGPPETVSEVPVKFFGSFATIEAARAELRALVDTKALNVMLEPIGIDAVQEVSCRPSLS